MRYTVETEIKIRLLGDCYLVNEVIQMINRINGSLNEYEVYMNDIYFFDTHYKGRPYELAKAISNGKYKYEDDYVRIDEDMNLLSISKKEYNVMVQRNLDKIIIEIIKQKDNIETSDNKLNKILREIQ